MEYTVEPTRLISNKLKESVGKNANSEQESFLFRIFLKKNLINIHKTAFIW